ncbi:hypothetical protein C8J57DRAFT_1733073 [Mycena rebaudengoi]|nr:hypothetical protein C8J57DRAFT_1733073 [Mycena rebaudengoi]
MSLGPAPLLWLRPRLLVSYSAICVESGRQRLYFRSASFLMRVHLAFISLIAAPHTASARRALLHDARHYAWLAGPHHPPTPSPCRSRLSRPVHTCSPHPGACTRLARVWGAGAGASTSAWTRSSCACISPSLIFDCA